MATVSVIADWLFRSRSARRWCRSPRLLGARPGLLRADGHSQFCRGRMNNTDPPPLLLFVAGAAEPRHGWPGPSMGREQGWRVAALVPAREPALQNKGFHRMPPSAGSVPLSTFRRSFQRKPLLDAEASAAFKFLRPLLRRDRWVVRVTVGRAAKECRGVGSVEFRRLLQALRQIRIRDEETAERNHICPALLKCIFGPDSVVTTRQHQDAAKAPPQVENDGVPPRFWSRC